MQIKRLRKNKKFFWTIVVLLALAGFSAYYYVYGLGGNLFGWSASPMASDYLEESTDTADLGDPSQEQIQAGEETKSESVKNQVDEDAPTPDTKSVSMTVAAVVNDGMLRIQTTVDKITNSGTCSLTLTKDNIVKRYPSVGVQALSGYSTCKFADIHTSSLSSGTWKVIVNFHDKSSEAKASTNVGI